MKVYLDIDGVVTPSSPGMISYISSELGSDVTPEDIVTYSLLDYYDISRLCLDELIVAYFMETPDLPVYPGAPEVIRELISSFDVCYTTSRDKRTRFVTEQFLLKHGILATVYFNGVRKSQMFKGERNAVLVEDNGKTSEIVADMGLSVLLMDQPYNQGLEHPNITRVYSWGHIEGILLGSNLLTGHV